MAWTDEDIELAWAAGFFDGEGSIKRGHEFTADNIYTYKNRPSPARLCRACNRENTRKSKARRRAQTPLLAAAKGRVI